MTYIALFRAAGSVEERQEIRDKVRLSAARPPFDPNVASRQVLLIGIDEPRELGLYREGTDFSPPYDVAIKASFKSKSDAVAALKQLRLPSGLSNVGTFLTEEVVKKGTADGDVDGEVPGIRMLHPLRFHEDLPRSALLRSWRDIHGELAKEAHSGGHYYGQFLVTDTIQVPTSPIGGFSEFQFGSKEALITGYFASDEARKAVRHDIRHFIAGIPPRLFATAYGYSR